MKKTLLFAVMILMGVSSAYAQTDQAAAGADLKSVQDVTRADSTPQDMKLNEEVRTSLQNDSALEPVLKDVQLKTVNGVVHLKGTVASEAQMKSIEEKVRACPGVAEVKNFIHVAAR